MKLSYEGILDRAPWQRAGIGLPGYDVRALHEATVREPRWVHFGIGNIFRIFIGGIADELIEAGLLDRGITCVETFDGEIVDRIYRPYDDLTLAVTLYRDGTSEERVQGALAEAVDATDPGPETMERLRQIFTAPTLQLVSFTITEKGYLPGGPEDPDKPRTAMGLLTGLLYERFRAGRGKLALVSMDNVSRNGEKLRNAVMDIAADWCARGLAEEEFSAYLGDGGSVSFPWTMIDRITPRPSEDVRRALTDKGVEGMEILVTRKHTYIAPYANAEGPRYLVIEDDFPNGRPPLERAGVYMTDRRTVDLSERMKVTACLNPIHTALAPFDCMLGYVLFASGMSDPMLGRLARLIGYGEGLPMVESPGILSPEAFLEEVLTERFPNAALGDTSARIAVDISQCIPFRFGETIRAWTARDGSAAGLRGIPLAIAGWIRYLLAVDDAGRPMELSPDPMIPELREKLKDVRFGEPDSLGDALRPILTDERIFRCDLYAVGLGGRIEAMVRRMLTGPGAVRAALEEYLREE